ncbi:MAG: carboxypeptidase-like regulatory domain-containing protein [Candidatus Solibacter sp.]
MPRSSAILILAAAATVWAQSAEDKLAAVSGTVVDAATGAPIVRAHVTCDGYLAGKAQQFGALTNAEGKFSISALPAGSYQLGAERIGGTWRRSKAARRGCGPRCGRERRNLA